VVNTCTVTHAAERTSRKVARRGRRSNRRLMTVLTGCYVGQDPERAAALAGVDLVVPNEDKDRLVAQVEEHFQVRRGEIGLPIPYVRLPFGQTRGLVKVEDGCNMRCSFCIIPFTRGRQRSRPLEECVDEVRALAEGGYREVVVTGVQISAFRDQGHGLFELVRAMLEETPVERLRLTSIAPWHFDQRLLGLFRDPRLCRHLHFSLQSGCTETLRRMRRPYTGEQFRQVVERVRDAIPEVAVTTDVIVGFPGETRREFEESLEFVESLAFSKVHVFPYSRRPGTDAADLSKTPGHEAVRRRVSRMLAVAAESERRFWASHLGLRRNVLFESGKNGTWPGWTDNYVRVFARSEAPLFNRILPVRLTGLTEDGVLATRISATGGQGVGGG
ncbi:MAG: MiaB/RimO family radical SAM methylthiotransferase, partial [Acidobacteria bacterium]|nr:MiaB/RimO family radical SAM methylthiotransferase [Acidobacteriota bacterium]